MRKDRIKQWVCVALVGILFVSIGQWIKNRPKSTEKQALTVCAPSNMEDAFEDALYFTNLKDSYKIVMTDDSNSNICVDYAKQDDKSYQKFAFSPFVVAYNKEDKYLDKLKSTNVCVKSNYDKDYYEIDFFRIIEEATGDGKWENLGIKDQGNIKVFYPDKETAYWNDFHDFLLVNVNDGKYPKNTLELENAEKVIQQFLDSKYTEGITDFNEQVQRTGGFPSSVIYVFPENIGKEICSNENVYARFYFPTTTVYLNYYVKGDELGKQVIAKFEKETFFHNFYEQLKYESYRSVKYSKLGETSSYVYDERDVYNVVKIPEKVESSTDIVTEDETKK